VDLVPWKSSRAVLVLAFAAQAFAACGGSSPSPRATDGGVDGADGGDGAAIGRRSFDVVITLGTLTRDPTQAGGWDDFPKTFASTITWDEATGDAFVGGGGAFSKLAVSTTDGQRYTSSGPWFAAAPFVSACDHVGSLHLDTIDFTIDGAGALRGTGRGKVAYQTGDTTVSLDADVTLAGAPDVTPPTFTWPSGDLDPLAPLWFEASEPLPPDAAASLSGATSGDVVLLSTAPVDLLMGAVRAVGRTGVALRYDETYTLATAGLADFVGQRPAPVTVKTRAAPPLVPEDGFESVTGTMFAGAGVLHGGPLTPIAGQTSLMLNTGFGGGFGFLPYDLGSSLAVRLAVSPGDTVVRFEAQLIAPDPVDEASFDGAILIGSAGHDVAMAMGVGGQGFERFTLPQLGDVFMNPVKTFEYPLPADVTGEVTFEIVGVTFKCGLPPSPTVLVIDNLRTE
jgi:hypothetical protein